MELLKKEGMRETIDRAMGEVIERVGGVIEVVGVVIEGRVGRVQIWKGRGRGRGSRGVRFNRNLVLVRNMRFYWGLFGV